MRISIQAYGLSHLQVKASYLLLCKPTTLQLLGGRSVLSIVQLREEPGSFPH